MAFFRAPFKRANQSARFPLANTTEPDLDLDGTFAPILKRNLYYELFINVLELSLSLKYWKYCYFI